MSTLNRRILIVEDELLMQRLLEDELTSLGFIVQSVPSVVEAKKMVVEFDPDIALIDISLKGNLNGIHLGHMLAKAHPDIAQVYLTKYEDVTAVKTGGLQFPKGAGFLSKHRIRTSNQLIEEIDRVAAGLKHKSDFVDEGVDKVANLSPKTKQVLEALVEGFTNQHIAEQMGITAKAVEYHVKAIYKAFGITQSQDRNARVEAAVRYERDKFAVSLADSDTDPK